MSLSRLYLLDNAYSDDIDVRALIIKEINSSSGVLSGDAIANKSIEKSKLDDAVVRWIEAYIEEKADAVTTEKVSGITFLVTNHDNEIIEIKKQINEESDKISALELSISDLKALVEKIQEEYAHQSITTNEIDNIIGSNLSDIGKTR